MKMLLRLLLAAVFFLTACGKPLPTFATPVVVHSTACGAVVGGTSFVCTLSATPASGNVLAVVASVEASGCTTAGVYTSLGAGSVIVDNIHFAGDQCAAQGYLIVPGSPPTSLTLTTSSAGVIQAVVFEFSGVSTIAPLDKHTTTAPLSLTCTTSTVTPAQSGDAVVAWGANPTGDDSPVSVPATSPSTTITSFGSEPKGGTGVYTGIAAISVTVTFGDISENNACGFMLLAGRPNQAGGMVGDIVFEQLVKML